MNFVVAMDNLQTISPRTLLVFMFWLDILNSDSKNYMALLLMGASYQENDKEKAAVYLRRAVKESPENPTVALQGLSSCAEVEELPNIFGKLLNLVP
uniref:Uncharacterized protein n=1 Tax=Megaselia scalaris TaxID=36166 RepID=T1GX98_MEGSC